MLRIRVRDITSITLLSLILASCSNDEPISINTGVVVNELKVSVPVSKAVSATINQDWSKQITQEIFYVEVDWPPQNPNGYCPLPADYVLVGGGAETLDTNTGSGGGYLYESRPDFANNRWYAGSKDHKVADPHRLRIYAIGIKLNGVSAATLRTYMTVQYQTSAALHHPSYTVGLPAGYKLVGGGAKVNWNIHGNLLVSSYPNGNSWTASAKDHIYSDQSTITVYAIGLQENIPGFGTINFVPATSDPVAVSSGSNSAQYYASIVGKLVTCPGARDAYVGTNGGRMLTAMFGDVGLNAIGRSKDNTIPTEGTLTTYALQIEKQH